MIEIREEKSYEWEMLLVIVSNTKEFKIQNC